jgi:MFS family permease
MPKAAQDFNWSEVILGLLDSAFLFSYAIGLNISGQLGDFFGHKRVLIYGFIGTGAAIFSIAFLGTLQMDHPKLNTALFMILFIINGFSQSTILPNSVAIMSHWFPENTRRLRIMGYWSPCAGLGNIVGLMTTGVAIQLIGLKWYYESFGIVIMIICLISMVMMYLKDHPGVKLTDEEKETGPALSYKRVIKLPG